jgi:hypothetical protein
MAETEVRLKPGEIMFCDGEGCRKYRLQLSPISAILEVRGKSGIMVMYNSHDGFQALMLANWMEIHMSKYGFDVKIGNVGWVKDDKIVLYNYDKTKVIDEVSAIHGFAYAIAGKHVINITMDLQHAVEHGFVFDVDIDRVRNRKYLYITAPAKIKAKPI